LPELRDMEEAEEVMSVLMNLYIDINKTGGHLRV